MCPLHVAWASSQHVEIQKFFATVTNRECPQEIWRTSIPWEPDGSWSIIWSQKSHSITFMVFCWSESQACPNLGNIDSPHLDGRNVKDFWGHVLKLSQASHQPHTGVSLEWNFWYCYLQTRTYCELWLCFYLTVTESLQGRGSGPVILPLLQPLAGNLVHSKYLASELGSEGMNKWTKGVIDAFCTCTTLLNVWEALTLICIKARVLWPASGHMLNC